MRLLRPLSLALLALAGCMVESSRPPITAGDGVTVDGKTQTVAIDPAKVPIQDQPCLAGQVLRRAADGQKWECVTPADVSPDHIPNVVSCAEGQLVSRTATGWQCVDPLDPTQTPIVPSCPTGQFVRKTADGWICAPSLDPDQTPVIDACPVGQVITRTASGWACAPAIDSAHTPFVAACPTGQVVVKTDTGWDCTPMLDAAHTPVVAQCNAGQMIRRTASGWECIDIPGPDPLKTPIVPTCAAGQYVRRTANGWECTALVGDLTGNVKGNVTGDLTGNVTGNLKGNVTGNVVGSLLGPVTGDVTGNLVGNVSGNVTGSLTGNVTGDTTGKHTGPVFGDVTGSLKGNVTGDLTGNSAGTHTGPVVGNVTGNVTGNVKGNVVGNVTGDLTGNVTGNVVGNLSGNVVGNVTGDTTGKHTGQVIGNVTGDVTGNLKGNVQGNVTGDLIGNVSGNVSGTASNVTGTVAVGHGGTGVTTFSTGSLIAMGATTMQGIPTGAQNTVLANVGGNWAPAALSDLGAVSRTGSTTNLYVHLDGTGNDTECNGTADVNYSNSAKPNCAVATPQGALDKLPDIVMHNVTINLGAGTLRVPAGGVGIDIAKVVRSSVSITIKGSSTAGATVISGATAAAPTTATGARGLFTSLPIENLVISNLTFDRFTDAGIRVVRSSALLENISVTNSNVGIICERASTCTATTALTLTGNSSYGLILSNEGRYYFSGATTISAPVSGQTVPNGIYLEYGSVMQNYQSGASGAAAPSLSINVGGTGLQLAQSSSTALIGTLGITAAQGHGIVSQERSSVTLAATTTITTSAASTYAFLTNIGSYTVIAGGSVSATCNGATSIGLGTYHNSLILFINAVATNISGCSAGESTQFHSTFWDASTGTKTNGAGVGVQVDYLSVYNKGGFPTIGFGNCKSGSQCP